MVPEEVMGSSCLIAAQRPFPLMMGLGLDRDRPACLAGKPPWQSLQQGARIFNLKVSDGTMQLERQWTRRFEGSVVARRARGWL
jgi:hypothetical protein